MSIDYGNDDDYFEYNKNRFKTETTRIKSVQPSEGWLDPAESLNHVSTIHEEGNMHVHEDGETSTDEDSRTNLLFSTETRRKLENRHVQLIAISGVIGTALFVAIGKALYRGGPASLLLAFALWCVPILCITVSTAEMVCFFPVSSPFLRLATKCVDESLAVMASWNFWFLECVQIPFEIVSVNTIIHYWRDDYSAGIPLAVQVVLYLLISICAVKYYGEMEFWLASFKIILALGLFIFTFVTMLGGNPKHDRYGFRYYGEVHLNNISLMGKMWGNRQVTSKDFWRV